MNRLSTDPVALFKAAREGQRLALARLMSLVERGGDEARLVGSHTFPQVGNAYTIGMTGAPGSGKSSLTSVLASVVRAEDQRLAILAVDPSSPFTGGAILGDRVRMQDHVTDEGIYIRSMATRGHLGGLSLATPQAVRVLDALGWPWVLIETVGVGQVEVDIAGAADTTIVVVNPGWGDAVQANKAGLMEVADIFVVNKSDRKGADDTRRDIQQMLELSSLGDWEPPILMTVATDQSGADELWKAVNEHRSYLETSDELTARRNSRIQNELAEIVQRSLERNVAAVMDGSDAAELRQQLIQRDIDPYTAAALLIDMADE
ncbi:MAG: methylmalonyl Co-A mutase-associated GTPase MeaB [Actinomycetota bacterium]|jgi:LAO/AO transport system kinase|nr:methylmalonyl Co-A mutase-associated GTPase MeaB [Acidimicrobiaceae bacterium]MEC7917047.1 methylmalonyl Co-A mutase-associated GTPase MeaB [Actinomycetota bacterium]MEE3255907.1 methylmalonyl Co-A mutase-associated GTPase MeaB [Actinomycetota bacterium]